MPQAHHLAGELKGMVSQTLEAVHDLAVELRPSALDVCDGPILVCRMASCQPESTPAEIAAVLAWATLPAWTLSRQWAERQAREAARRVSLERLRAYGGRYRDGRGLPGELDGAPSDGNTDC